MEGLLIGLLATALFTVIGLLGTAVFQLRGRIDATNDRVTDLGADMNQRLGEVVTEMATLTARFGAHREQHEPSV